MMDMLNDNEDNDLPYHLAHLTFSEFDRLSELLMHLYESSGRLLLRLAQMATIEGDGDVSNNKLNTPLPGRQFLTILPTDLSTWL